MYAGQLRYPTASRECAYDFISTGVNGLLDKIPVEKITAWERDFLSHLTSSQSEMLKEISGGKMTPELESALASLVGCFNNH